MKKVYLIALDGTAVDAGHHILGFLSSNNQYIITNYIKNIFGLTLQNLLPNKVSFQNGCHWEYLTDRPGVNVHVDVCYNLE